MATRPIEIPIKLQGDDLESTANKAASALDNLQASIDSDVKALQGMEKAMRNLQRANVVEVATAQKLRKEIDAKKQAIVKAQAAYLNLGGEFGKTAKRARDFGANVKAATEVSANGANAAADAVNDLVDKFDTSAKGSRKLLDETGAFIKQSTAGFDSVAASASAMPGPLGQAAGQLSRVTSMFAKAAQSTVVFTIAVVAMTAAVIAATVALAKYGLAAADRRRSEALDLESLTKMRFWYTRIPLDAKAMQASIDRVSASVASSRDEVTSYNQHLAMLGLRGKNLDVALQAYATAMSAGPGGRAAAERFAGLAASVQMAGGSVQRLADDINARFGEIAARRMLSLDVMARKLGEAFDAMFADLKIEPALKGIKSLTDLFTQSTVSGRVLKGLLMTWIQPFMDGVAKGAPIAKRFFQGMLIEAIRLTNAFLRIAIAVKRATPKWSGDYDAWKTAVTAGKVVVLALGVAFAFLAGNVIAATWPFLLAGVAIYALINTVRLLGEAWDEFDFGAMVHHIFGGFIEGISEWSGKIKDKIVSLGKNVKKWFADTLGIKSPSTVFAELGIQIPAGVAVGVKTGAPLAQRSVDEMIKPSLGAPGATTPRVGPMPEIGAPPAAPSPGLAASGGVNVTIGDIVVSGTDPNNAQAVAMDIRREIERVLESVALQLGARVGGEA